MTEPRPPPPPDTLDRLNTTAAYSARQRQRGLVAALERPRIPAIRLNTLKIDVDEARRTWPEWYGWEVQPVPFCAAGWQILQQNQPIGQTLEYDMGPLLHPGCGLDAPGGDVQR